MHGLREPAFAFGLLTGEAQDPLFGFLLFDVTQFNSRMYAVNNGFG